MAIWVNVGSTVTGNTVSQNAGTGIIAIIDSTVTNNTVQANNQDDASEGGGVWVAGDCLVKNNVLVGNLQANIRVDGAGIVIEENLVTRSTNGIIFLFSGNFYANNRASNNTTAFNLGATTQTDGGGNVEF